MHWSGCPNSCGKHRIADIGLQGCRLKVDGKAVPGVRLFVGGRLGRDAALGTLHETLPCTQLADRVFDLIAERFADRPGAAAAAEASTDAASAGAPQTGAHTPLPEPEVAPREPIVADEAEAAEGGVRIHCRGDGYAYVVSLQPGETLLDAAIEAGAEHLAPPTAAERALVGPDLQRGFRLDCQVRSAAGAAMTRSV